jgi:hypothetical protein
MPFHNTKIRKQMEKIYRQVSVKERLPDKPGAYNTDFGKLGFRPNNFDKTDGIWSQVHYIKYPSVWYEEVELPTDKDIDSVVSKYRIGSFTSDRFKSRETTFKDGANYILNTLKGEKR